MLAASREATRPIPTRSYAEECRRAAAEWLEMVQNGGKAPTATAEKAAAPSSARREPFAIPPTHNASFAPAHEQPRYAAGASSISGRHRASNKPGPGSNKHGKKGSKKHHQQHANDEEAAAAPAAEESSGAQEQHQ